MFHLWNLSFNACFSFTLRFILEVKKVIKIVFWVRFVLSFFQIANFFIILKSISSSRWKPWFHGNYAKSIQDTFRQRFSHLQRLNRSKRVPQAWDNVTTFLILDPDCSNPDLYFSGQHGRCNPQQAELCSPLFRLRDPLRVEGPRCRGRTVRRCLPLRCRQASGSGGWRYDCLGPWKLFRRCDNPTFRRKGNKYSWPPFTRVLSNLVGSPYFI